MLTRTHTNTYTYIYTYINTGVHKHAHTYRRTWRYMLLICDKECHNSKFVIFQEKRLKALKCYNFLWVQRRHNCSPAASFANCVMTLYLLKVHLQTFLSIPITQKYQILSCYTLVANERLCKTVNRCNNRKEPCSQPRSMHELYTISLGYFVVK